jgi:hypothetical protein
MDDSSGARFCAQAAALTLFFLDFGRAVYIAGDGAKWAGLLTRAAADAAPCTGGGFLHACAAIAGNHRRFIRKFLFCGHTHGLLS